MAALRVLILAADPLARAGLAALLAGESTLLISGQAKGDDDPTSLLTTYRPDLVLWDLGWETATVLEQIAAFIGEESSHASLLPDDGPVVVALLADDATAADAWRAGVRGLLPRDVDAGRLVAGLAAAGAGLLVIDPAFAAVLQQPSATLNEPPLEPLTPRELDVLKLVAEGLPNKSIARQLEISEHTVKFHLNAILGKLGVNSRTEAVVRATRAGLILL